MLGPTYIEQLYTHANKKEGHPYSPVLKKIITDKKML